MSLYNKVGGEKCARELGTIRKNTERKVDMQPTLVGIDVSAYTLDVCLEGPDGLTETLKVENKRKCHLDLVKRLTQRRRQAKVVLEPSGVYHLELALTLHRADRIELMVVNPRAARDFARAAMQRSKTDALDAAVLLEYGRRMPFQQWNPPAPEELELRTMVRRIASMVKNRTQEKNRLHAAEYVSDAVSHDIEVNIGHLGRRIAGLRKKALKLIWDHPLLRKRFTRLMSVTGIGQTSAIQILGELCILPKDMAPRQWVAMAGLDPRIVQSGLSVNAPARISRMGNRALRAALFLPAMTAIRWEASVKAFYDKLIGKQKAPMQAIVAVMRKLLHAIHGMFRTDTDFDGRKFYNPVPKCGKIA